MIKFFPIIALLISSCFLIGCGNEESQAPQSRKVAVKAMQVLQMDTPLSDEFAGQIVATNEVKVQSRISGSIVDKKVNGGQFVNAGDLLFVIDPRPFEAAFYKAQADFFQAQANFENAKKDLERYQQLLAEGAIAIQVVDNQKAQTDAYYAIVESNRALLQNAQLDLEYTQIYAPMSGQLSVDDVAVGTFVTAGQTSLVTIGSVNPIFARFSVSETDFLKFQKIQELKSEPMNIQVSLTLSDGSQYPLLGEIVEQDRELANNSGSLTMKALFPNPDGKLIPGMFARVKLSGDTRPNSILVPQRAVQQLLGKSFVMVVNSEGKSEARPINLGDKVGSYYIVNEGVTTSDTVVIEGLTNLQEGVDLDVAIVSPREMGFSVNENSTAFNEDSNLGR